MSTTRTRFSLLLIALSLPASALAQSLPASQPALLSITREEVKPGRTADHARIEAGWPAAYEKAKSPDYYLALASLTGTNEVWFVSPYASHDAQGASMARDDEPALAAELARLSRADGEVLTGIRRWHARARNDLSYGAYPDLTKMRFWEIAIFRVRPGHDRHFTEAAKAYVSASGRAGSKNSFRTYEVIAGAVGSTYMIFSSVASFAQFDQTVGNDEAVMKAATPDEGTLLQKFMSEGVVTVETQRFRLDPVQSYVSKEVRATDAAFWMPKKPAAPKPAASQP
jgi:hypothetical protein